MHQITTTDALVLGKRGVGEANVLVSLLTRDLGLLRVSARSARLDVSKLRYGLEPLTRARYSMVRGRHEWKLTGVAMPRRLPPTTSREQRQAAGRIARLLLRLIHGEEPVPDLYATVVAGLDALLSISEIESVECVLVLRILSQLGYVSDTAEAQPFLVSTAFTPEVLAAATASRLPLVHIINASIAVTGL